MHPALANFVIRMDNLVAGSDDPHHVAEACGRHLAELLEHPECLAPTHRQPDDEAYRQHVVHVHPEGRYSIVSLVWLPGQATPIHDHRCWCVVGVLKGREREERFSLHAEGDDEWLADEGATLYDPGQVCCLVPPVEDIHRVVNAADDVSISLHIYGADIATVGTSINRTFDLEVRDGSAATATSWRKRDHVPSG